MTSDHPLSVPAYSWSGLQESAGARFLEICNGYIHIGHC
uniref:Uncharacterized protein n=1 Tax=Anguilla anguilla TaxID=7936 RepID=A0A0E9SM02_ANGAN